MENIETLLAAVAQTQGFDDDEPDAPTGLDVGSRDSESSPVIQGESGDFRSSSFFSADAQQSMVMAMPPPAPVPASRAAGPLTGDGEKRKRGRPPKGQLPSIPPPPKRTKVEDEEEDVCFICFDGGSLVLCDRKGCPKAYHPACVKRDEAFFRSKAKWNCGWHICSVCRKASHYICYTCTYSLCKGCTKDTDYLSVRGNKGFCSTCMKTIMLIEDKDHANSDSVQVDFDDKTSWEYLFKVYWVCLKEKLSLNLTELRQATKPWKPVAALASRGQSRNLRNRSVDGRVSISLGTGEHSELSKPHLQTSLLQNDEGSRLAQSSNDNHVEIVNISNGDGPTSDNGTLISTHLVLNKPHLETSSPQNDEVRTEQSSISDSVGKLDSSGVEGEACHDKGIGKLNMDEPIQELGIDMQGIENDQDNVGNDKNAVKSCISNGTISEELPEQQNCKGVEWASKDLLDFVAHMKNGDISAMSPFDVQTLLLNYIKRNHLRDPRRKSQIVCDSKLKTLFGKPRVGHIEMLKLLEYHFLIKDDSLKNSFIPAGFVSSGADDMEVDDHNNESSFPVNSRKRKMRRKSEDATTQNNLSDYAAIDIQNINLIYLRRNLMENLIEDNESFNDKVVGTIVRIKIASNDQKQNVHRLVQVVGTRKASEPYKVGDKTADIMLEVLNLDKKELVSIDALSNQEFTEDECRRLRQSIRCGLVKQLTVGEVQKKAMSLQAVRVSDWLKVEIQRLNHLRDRASENGRKKELREHVSRLQLLNSPEERLRRISEVPNVNADAKMDPNYVSEEDVKSDDNCKTDEYKVQNSSGFLRSGRKLVSPSTKGKEKQPVHEQNSAAETVGVSASLRLDSYLNRATVSNPTSCTVTDQFMQDSGEEASAVRNSGSSDHIETERLWHYRDPNGKIQGPFAMMQLRKWSTTGLFPPEMRIWTNHEQYDSLLLVDALNGQFHGASEMSRKPPSESEENGGAASRIWASTDAIRNGGEFRRIEATSSNNTSILPEKAIGPVEAKELSSSWPQCRDLLKDSCASDVQARNIQLDRRLDCDELNHGSQIVDKIPAQVSQNLGAGGSELQKHSDNEDRAGPCTEKALRSLNIDLGSDDMESVPAPVAAPISTIAEPSKQVGSTFIFDLPSPTPSENHQSVPLVASAQKACILELLSPAPRSNSEDQGGQGTETKQAGILDFTVTSLCPSWSIDVNSVLDDVQMPGVADEWCGYSPTPVKPSVHEWDPSLISPSSLKPPGVGVAGENLGTSSTSSNIQMTHAPNIPNWLTTLSETIEFDALGEESVSDLLAEVDAMESQGTLPSPTSALKFARELLEDCKDDCFSSIEEFSSAHGPIKSDALSSSSEIHFTSHSCSGHLGPSTIDAFDFFSKSSVHSSAASSEGENKAPVYSGDAGSEFHPSTSNNTNHEMMGATVAPDSVDPGWGNVQGNINLVTVQGNVNLVLGGPAQGMANLNWGANPGTAWGNTSHGPGSLPWDGQRKYNGERFSSPREWAYQGNDSGFGRSRPPWSRQPYSGGGYTRPPKGQRVCKFYESGHCKKGAFCDYLHP